MYYRPQLDKVTPYLLLTAEECKGGVKAPRAYIYIYKVVTNVALIRLMNCCVL